MITYLSCPVCGRTKKIRKTYPYPTSLSSTNSWGPLVINEVCPECAAEQEDEEDEDETI